MKISYAILCKDEEQYLPKLLDTIIEYKSEEDEIVIVTDNPTEGVIKILNDYSITHYDRPLNNDFGAQKNFLNSKCTGDYIFNIDADECPHECLIGNLHELLNQNDIDVYYVPRVNTVEGLTQEHIQKWGWRVNEQGWVNWPDPQMRIYKNKDNINWCNKVHEIIRGYDTFARLPIQEEYSLLHHKDINRQEKQNEHYSKIQ